MGHSGLNQALGERSIDRVQDCFVRPAGITVLPAPASSEQTHMHATRLGLGWAALTDNASRSGRLGPSCSDIMPVIHAVLLLGVQDSLATENIALWPLDQAPAAGAGLIWQGGIRSC